MGICSHGFKPGSCIRNWNWVCPDWIRFPIFWFSQKKSGRVAFAFSYGLPISDRPTRKIFWTCRSFFDKPTSKPHPKVVTKIGPIFVQKIVKIDHQKFRKSVAKFGKTRAENWAKTTPKSYQIGTRNGPKSRRKITKIVTEKSPKWRPKMVPKNVKNRHKKYPKLCPNRKKSNLTIITPEICPYYQGFPLPVSYTHLTLPTILLV